MFLPFCVVPQPKMIVTASFGIEPGRRVEYIPLVEKALQLSSHRPSKVLVYNRPGMVRGEVAAADGSIFLLFLLNHCICFFFAFFLFRPFRRRCRWVPT